ncbi:MAG: carotenoid oxygenase family protein [Acidimicrobiales bacterium]|nr:carotenoid oxygenase family protein [Acidimicrobiales bacterium]
MSTTEADATTTTPTDLPWHLQGNYGPIKEELDLHDLEVEGVIPPEIDGVYMRNGFNPITGWSDHWFFGDGMIHAVDIRDGKASIHNRYVRTPVLEGGADGMSMDPANSPANTNIVPHAGRLFALNEGFAPYEVDRDLDTIGMENFDGQIVGPFTAHPKLCPVTGEMLAFGYSVVGPEFLRYYRFDASGALIQAEPITLPSGVMMHDVNITRNHVIWMDLPVCFSLDKAMQGEAPFGWNPDNGTRLGVMPRDGGDADVRWFDIEPGYVLHPVNSWEDGDKIVLVVCRLASFMDGGFDDISGKAELWRWTIDLTAGTVKEEHLDDHKSDFPRVNDRLVGLPTRFGYTQQLGHTPDNPSMGQEIYKYDLETGIPEIHQLGNVNGGEPVFVPRGEDGAEDDGWIVLFGHDVETDTSEFRIIDAQDFSGPPVARVFSPQRVPYGAHGNWMPRG